MDYFNARKDTKKIEKWEKYINYINNTGLVPLPVSAFDEDWDPIGPMVRADMVKNDIIQVRGDDIYLRPDLIRPHP